MANLTTRANALLWLRRNNEVSQDDDDILDIIIASVSDAIENHIERQLETQNGATKTFSYDASGFVNIAPYELRNITSVTIGSGASAQVLTASTGNGDGQYIANPVSRSTEGTYLWLTVQGYLRPYPNSSLYSPILNERTITIVGDWGMSSVPARIELACLEAVALTYRAPEATEQRGQGEFAVINSAVAAGEMFNERILALLDPFIRPQSV